LSKSKLDLTMLYKKQFREKLNCSNKKY